MQWQVEVVRILWIHCGRSWNTRQIVVKVRATATFKCVKRWTTCESICKTRSSEEGLNSSARRYGHGSGCFLCSWCYLCVAALQHVRHITNLALLMLKCTNAQMHKCTNAQMLKSQMLNGITAQMLRNPPLGFVSSLTHSLSCVCILQYTV